MINEIYLDMGAETKRCKGCQERMTQEMFWLWIAPAFSNFEF